MTERPIPGTYIFDGRMARKGYALNKMCYSFNEAKNREAFKADETAYCERCGLNMQDIGAQQTGLSVQDFKTKLQSYARFNVAVNRGGPSRA